MKEMNEEVQAGTETVSTLRYMAPESISKTQYSEKSDIYAFAVCAFEIIEESKPFGELEGFELINSIVNEKKRPEFKKGSKPKFRSKDFISLVTECWAHEPDLRPSAHQVCKRMIKILKKFRNSSSSNTN